MLQARAQLNFNEPSVIRRRAVALIPIDKVNPSVSCLFGYRDVIFFTDELMLLPALSVFKANFANLSRGIENRPAAANILHPRQIHVRETAQLLENGGDALEPLCDQSVFISATGESSQPDLHCVQGKAMSRTPVI